MAKESKELLEQVAEYYDEKLQEHGQTPRGVDWNGDASQNLRFEQLCQLIAHKKGFSINDLGCGYGALCDYLAARFDQFEYNGYDVSADMISAAHSRLSGPNVHLMCTAELNRRSDYTVASGIFNVRMDRSTEEWERYLHDTLDAMDRASVRGFAFNCLSDYADADKMRKDLYYASPTRLFDLCKTRYARDVALLHDYRLFEFTLIVRKDA